MRVRMLVELSGRECFLVPGDEWEFPEDQAQSLIAAEYAIPAEAPEVERAVEDGIYETRPHTGKRGRRRREK